MFCLRLGCISPFVVKTAKRTFDEVWYASNYGFHFWALGSWRPLVYTGGASSPDTEFVFLLSLLVIKYWLVINKLWYNGGSFGSFPKGIFVVIDTHWVLCNCLMTHRYCVLAGGLCLCSPPLGVLR